MLKEIKRELYDGLIKDLMEVKAYGLSEIIYNEKLREKFPVNLKD
jgi:hypothetical protein